MQNSYHQKPVLMHKYNIMVILLVVLLSRFCLAKKLIACNDTNNTVRKDYICKIDQNYDKAKVPGTLPLVLDSSIYIIDVTKVNEELNSIILHARILITWIDPGLSYVKKSM